MVDFLRLVQHKLFVIGAQLPFRRPLETRAGEAPPRLGTISLVYSAIPLATITATAGR